MTEIRTDKRRILLRQVITPAGRRAIDERGGAWPLAAVVLLVSVWIVCEVMR